MQYSCYIEVNILCLILVFFFQRRLYQRRSMWAVADQVMSRMLIAVDVLCIADILAMVCRGRFFPGARLAIEGSNLLYLVMMPLIAMFWCDYTRSKLGKKLESRMKLAYRLPLIVFIVIALLNPVHHLLFSINQENLYVRGPGIFLHWIVSWFYFISAGVYAWHDYHSTTNWIQRSAVKPFLTFLILPAIGCVAQMLLYGITSVQAGITLSLTMVSLQTQDNQISSDELTGINNRKAMKRYIDTLLYSGASVDMTVLMVDVNHFKSINDTYGHAMGDLALRDVATRLKNACGQVKDRLFLCRYGGDEFVMIGYNISQQRCDEIVDILRKTVSRNDPAEERPYALEISIGHASAICHSADDFERCLQQADDRMYEDKKRLAATR